MVPAHQGPGALDLFLKSEEWLYCILTKMKAGRKADGGRKPSSQEAQWLPGTKTLSQKPAADSLKPHSLELSYMPTPEPALVGEVGLLD